MFFMNTDVVYYVFHEHRRSLLVYVFHEHRRSLLCFSWTQT